MTGNNTKRYITLQEVYHNWLLTQINFQVALTYPALTQQIAYRAKHTRLHTISRQHNVHLYRGHKSVPIHAHLIDIDETHQSCIWAVLARYSRLHAPESALHLVSSISRSRINVGMGACGVIWMT